MLEEKKGDVIKSSRFTTVIRFNNSVNGSVFYFKEYHNRGLKDIIKNILGFTRGKRELRGIGILKKNSFKTIEPVVYGCVKFCGLIYRNFLVTKGGYGEMLNEYFKNNYNLPFNKKNLLKKRALISKAGSEIGKMHAKGIFHGDLRAGNILIFDANRDFHFCFVDNERTKIYKRLPMKKRIKNLVQLNMLSLPHITKTDRLRFFYNYLEQNIELKNKKKDIIRTVHLITEKRLKHKYNVERKI